MPSTNLFTFPIVFDQVAALTNAVNLARGVAAKLPQTRQDIMNGVDINAPSVSTPHIAVSIADLYAFQPAPLLTVPSGLSFLLPVSIGTPAQQSRIGAETGVYRVQGVVRDLPRVDEYNRIVLVIVDPRAPLTTEDVSMAPLTINDFPRVVVRVPSTTVFSSEQRVDAKTGPLFTAIQETLAWITANITQAALDANGGVGIPVTVVGMGYSTLQIDPLLATDNTTPSAHPFDDVRGKYRAAAFEISPAFNVGGQ